MILFYCATRTHVKNNAFYASLTFCRILNWEVLICAVCLNNFVKVAVLRVLLKFIFKLSPTDGLYKYMCFTKCTALTHANNVKHITFFQKNFFSNCKSDNW